MLTLMTNELKIRLKAARKEAKLTQKDIVSRVGITQPAYSELETGKSASSSYLPQIARILGVDAHWLATGEGENTGSRTSESSERKLPLIPIASVYDWLQSGCDSSVHESGSLSYAMGGNLSDKAYIIDIVDDSVGSIAPKGHQMAIDPEAPVEHGKLAVYHLPEHNETYLGVYMSRAGNETLKFLDGSEPIVLDKAVCCGKARILLAKEL